MNGIVSSLLGSVLTAVGADPSESFTDRQWQNLVLLVAFLVTVFPLALAAGRGLRNWPAILVLCAGVGVCQRVTWAGEKHLVDLVAVGAWVGALVWSTYRGPRAAGSK